MTPLWLLSLIGFAVVIRAGVYASLSGEYFSRWINANWAEYLQALRDHFWEYVFHAHVKPPLLHLVHAVPAWIADSVEGRGFGLLMMSGALNVGATALVFSAAGALGARPVVSWVVAGLATIVWLLFDLAFLYHDTPALFFLALFIYAGARIVRRNGEQGYLFFGVAGALLIAQATVQAAVVPVVAALLCAMAPPDGKFWRRIIAGVGLPALMLVSLAGKNFGATGLPTTSSLGGHTFLLFARMQQKGDDQKLVALAREAGAPDWYTWCFENPQLPPGFPEDHPYRSWLPMIGGCVPGRHDADGQVRPDWQFLIDRLRELKAEERLVDAVRQDLQIQNERPYLRTGLSVYLGTNWAAQYNRVSASVAALSFRKDPFSWILNAKYVHGNLFTGLGPRLYPGLRLALEKDAPILRTQIYEIAYSAFAELTRYAYLVLPLVALVLLGAASATIFIAVLRRCVTLRLRLYWSIVAVQMSVAAFGFAVFVRSLEWFYYGWSQQQYRLLPLVYGVLWFGLILRAAFEIRRVTSPAATLHWLTFSRQEAAAWLLLLVPLLMMGAIFCTTVGIDNDRFFSLLGPHLCVVAALLLTRAAHLFQEAWAAAYSALRIVK